MIEENWFLKLGKKNILNVKISLFQKVENVEGDIHLLTHISLYIITEASRLWSYAVPCICLGYHRLHGRASFSSGKSWCYHHDLCSLSNTSRQVSVAKMHIFISEFVFLKFLLYDHLWLLECTLMYWIQFLYWSHLESNVEYVSSISAWFSTNF